MDTLIESYKSVVTSPKGHGVADCADPQGSIPAESKHAVQLQFPIGIRWYEMEPCYFGKIVLLEKILSTFLALPQLHKSSQCHLGTAAGSSPNLSSASSNSEDCIVFSGTAMKSQILQNSGCPVKQSHQCFISNEAYPACP